MSDLQSPALPLRSLLWLLEFLHNSRYLDYRIQKRLRALNVILCAPPHPRGTPAPLHPSCKQHQDSEGPPRTRGVQESGSRDEPARTFASPYCIIPFIEGQNLYRSTRLASFPIHPIRDLARSLFFLILMSASLPLRNHRILGFNSSTSRLSNCTRNLKYCKVVHLSRCGIRCIVNR